MSTPTKPVKSVLQAERLIIHNIPGVVYRCAMDGAWTMQFISNAVENLTGFPAETFINNQTHSYASLIHPEDMAYVERVIQEATLEKRPFEVEYRVMHASGEIRWVFNQGRGVDFHHDQPRWLDGVMIDNSARKGVEFALQEAHDALSESQARLQGILDNTSAAIYLKDLEGRYLLVNTPFCTISGVTEAEALGKTDVDLFPPQIARRFQESDREIIESRRSMQTEDRVEQAAGVRHYVTAKFPLMDDNGNLMAIGGVSTDITRIKRIEDALRQAKQEAEAANRAKSRFLATMSHDIRSPLNAVLGMGELLAETDLNEKQRKYLVSMHRASEFLLALINDILDLSKIESGQLELEQMEMDVDDLIHSTLEIFSLQAQEKGLKLTCRLDAQATPWVIGDRGRLRQVLVNLINNAIKFTQRGSVSVMVHQQVQNTYQFCVSDTGIGIPKERLKAVFDPFIQADSATTRRYGGTGLGLAICQQLVALMGGNIWVESEVGKGCQFYFTACLPAATNATERTSQRSKEAVWCSSIQKKTPAEGLSILLADDAEDARMVIQSFLKSTPHRLALAETGKEALEKFQEGDYDLILMDVEMPVMDGLSATRGIRAWEAVEGSDPVPIVALTGHSIQEKKQEALEAGYNFFLTKPIRKKRLLEFLQPFMVKSGKEGGVS